MNSRLRTCLLVSLSIAGCLSFTVAEAHAQQRGYIARGAVNQYVYAPYGGYGYQPQYYGGYSYQPQYYGGYSNGVNVYNNGSNWNGYQSSYPAFGYNSGYSYSGYPAYTYGYRGAYYGY